MCKALSIKNFIYQVPLAIDMKLRFIAILAILLVPFVSAQEAASPGILPGSPLYWLDRSVEGMQLGLSGQGIPRARIYLLFAEERLAEAKALQDKSKPARVVEMTDGYEDYIAKAGIEIDKAKRIGIDVSTIINEMDISIDRHIIVLELVLANAPESAKSGIQRALDNVKSNSARLKEQNKKAGVGIDITGDVVLSQDELRKKQEELARKEEELNKKEEELKGKGLIPITGFVISEQEKYELLKQNAGIIFLITILGTFLYFYYIARKRHRELHAKLSKKK